MSPRLKGILGSAWLVLLLSAAAQAATYVSGPIAADTTWAVGGSPYVVTGSVSVDPLVTLTIDPGVVVKFEQYMYLQVNGILNATGTSTGKIHFTDLRDDSVGGDTNGDGGATSPGAGWWAGVWVPDGGKATMVHTSVRYAGYGGYGWSANVYKTGAESLSLSNSTIRHSSGQGVWIQASTANHAIGSNVLENNAGNGIYLNNDSGTITISGNTVRNNGSNGVGLANVGGAAAITANAITGNGGWGIYFDIASRPSAISGNTITGNASGPVGIGGGSLSADTAWPAGGSPYVITSSITVDPGVTLTVRAGVVLKFAQYTYLQVNGNLNATGTAGSIIHFTDLRDDSVGGDTNGDGGATGPGAGWWTGVWVPDAGTATMVYTSTRYAGYGGYGWSADIYKTGTGSLVLTNSSASNCSGQGVQIQSSGASHTLLLNVIENNAGHGVYLNGNSGSIGVSDSIVRNNGGSGLHLASAGSAVPIAGTAITGNGGWGVFFDIASRPPAISGTAITGNTAGPVGIGGGSITADTTWPVGGSPYVVTGSIAVNPGVTLTIEPGVVLKFAQYAYLQVSGNLNATGTAAGKIHFTDHRDDSVGGDTNGDGGTTSPGAGWWSGIWVPDGGTATVVHSSVRYAGYGGYGWSANVFKSGTGSLSLANSTIRNSSGQGVWIQSSAADHTIGSSVIENNGGQGVYLNGDSGTITVSGNTVRNNGGNGIYLNGDGALAINSNAITGNGGWGVYFENSSLTTFNGNTFSGNASGRVATAGSITLNANWPVGASPIVVTSPVLVGGGSTLTIRPGVVVKFAQYGYLQVYGSLNATGTSGSPIRFTDLRDDSAGGDTNGDGSATSPAPGWWYGLRIEDGGSATLAYTSVGYAGYGWYASVSKAGSGSISVTNSTISNGSGYGLTVGGSASDHTIGNNVIENNSSLGIYLDSDSGMIAISGNTVRNNGNNGLQITNTSGAVTVSGNTINNNAGQGVYLAAAGSGVALNTNTIRDNGANGVWIGGGSAVALAGNTITGNAHYGIYLDDSTAPVLSGNTITGNGYGAIGLGGNITSNRTWTLAGSPYIVNTGMYVHPGATLTIEPGVVLKFVNYAYLQVAGSLNATGTSGSPIWFTDLRDDSAGGDTNGDGGATSPSPGWWYGIRMEDGGTATLAYASVKYGGVGWYANVSKTGSGSLSVTNSTISHGSGYGLSVGGSASDHTIGNNVIENNGAIGIYLDSDSGAVAISGNTVRNNGGNGLQITNTSGAVTASGNTISNNASQGVYLAAAGSGVALNGNTIRDNSANGVYIGGGSAVALADNTITGNAHYGIYVDDSTIPVLSGNTITGNGYGPIGLGGNISSNRTWTLAGSPYTVHTGMVVYPGVTLTIEPGVVLKFAQNAYLQVLGILNATGTSGSVIHFTDRRNDSVGGDTNGDGGATSPSPGWWYAIRVEDGGSATLAYTTIKYAGGGWGANIWKTGSGSVSLTNSTVANGSGTGLYIQNSASNHTIRNNVFEINGYDGISLAYTSGTININGNRIRRHGNSGIFLNSASPAIVKNLIYGNAHGVYCVNGANPVVGGSAANGNDIYGNTWYSVYTDGSAGTVNARYNFWGDPAGPPTSGPNMVSANVDWANFLPASIFDTTAPTGSVTINGGATHANSQSVTLQLPSTDTGGVGTGYMCLSETTACTSWEAYAAERAWTFATADNETKNIYVWYRDWANNTETLPHHDSIILDTVPPDIAMASGPVDPTESTLADFAFSTTDPEATLQCRLDKDVFGPCASPKSYTGIADASYNLNLDGVDDYASAGNSAAFNFGSGDFTISFWAKPDNPATDWNDYDHVISKAETSSYAPYVIGIHGGQWQFWSTTGPGYGWNIANGFNFGAVSLHSWQYVTISRSGNMFMFYIDGVQTATLSTTAALWDNAEDLLFGMINYTGVDTHYRGALDEVNLWNVNRTPAEIQADMTGALTGAESGLVGYWKFDEGTGTAAADSTGDGNTATLVNMAIPWSSRHLAFDGAGDRATIPDSPVLNPTNLTVEAWIKAKPSLVGDIMSIVDKSHGFTDAGGWVLSIHPGGKAGFTYGNGSGFPEVQSASVLTDNRWHHLAGTLDGADLTVYVDGVLESTQPYPGATQGNARDLLIGMAWGGGPPQRFFNGSIDEVRVWNLARSQAEIQANMSRELAGTETGLVGYWKFNEGQGGTAADATANGNTATLSGAAWEYSDLAWSDRHLFEARSVDLAQNMATAAHEWSTSPDTSVGTPPANPSNSQSASFTLGSTKRVVTYECSLDAGSFGACTSPQNYAGLSEGEHTFTVRATDGTGLTDPTPASYTWLVDITQPGVTSATSTSANGHYRAGGAINVTLNFSEAVWSAGLTINLNSGGTLSTGALENVTSCSGTYTVADGQTAADLTISSIAGTITDAATNERVNPSVPAGQNIANFKAIVIDTTAPAVAIGSPSTAVTKAGPVTFAVTYADTNFEASTLDAGSITLDRTGTANGTVGVSGTGNSRIVTVDSITGNGTLGISLAAGTATDLAGNTAAAAGPSATFIVDNTNPTLGSLTPAALTSAPGAAQSFSAVYSDAAGFANLKRVFLLVNAAATGVNGISLIYDRTLNRLYLYNDAVTATVGYCTPGAAGSLSNSQGTLNCAATTVAGSGSSLTVTWNITPGAGFASATARNLYLYARDIADTPVGWTDKGDWTIKATNVAPTLGSVTPSALTTAPSAAQSFIIVYSDPDGYANLRRAQLLVNATATGVNGISVFHDRTVNKLYLYNDAGTAAVGNCTPGAAGSLSNSQGTLDCAATTVTGSGNNLTVTWNIAPSAAFASTTARNLYLYARDMSDATAGWTDKGDWMIKATNVAPTLGSVTPLTLTSAPAAAQSFSVVYSDPDGFANLKRAHLLANATATGVNGISVLHDRTVNKLYLYNDAGTATVGNCTPGAAGSLSNSQGTLNCAATTVTGSGNDLTVNWNITPSAGFASTTARNLYLYARDMSDATVGWTDKGDWKVKDTNDTPTLGSVTPSALTSSSGAAQSFIIVYSDPDGFANLKRAHLLVNATATGVNGISVLHDRTVNKLYLYNDAGTATVGNCTPGAAGSLSNSQGTLNCAATTVTGSGNDLTVNWNITPSAAFALGTANNLYLYARDMSDATAGWTDRGDWTVKDTNVAPTLGSVTPDPETSGPGVARSFSAVYSDADGFANLKRVNLLVNETATGVNGISLMHDRTVNKLYLYNDAGTTPVGNCTPGAPGSLTNSQGMLDCAATTVTGSGNDLTVTWNITPSAGFASSTPKNLYLYARDMSHASVGWTDTADWTIDAPGMAERLLAQVLWTRDDTGEAALWSLDPDTAGGDVPVIPVATSRNLPAPSGADGPWQAFSYQQVGETAGYVLWTRGDTGEAALSQVDLGRGTGEVTVTSVTDLTATSRLGAPWQATGYQQLDSLTGYVLWTRGDTGEASLVLIGTGAEETTVRGSSHFTLVSEGGEPWQAMSYQQVDAGTGYLLWTRSDSGSAVLWQVDPGTGEVVRSVDLEPATGLGAPWQATSYQHVGDGEGYVLWTRSDTGQAALWQIDPATGATVDSAYLNSTSGEGAHWQATGYAHKLPVGAAQGIE